MTVVYWWDTKSRRKPPCPRDPDAPGTPVLVWPYTDLHTGKKIVQQAYYGRRATGRPAFYLHGAEIHGVRCWASMPEVSEEFRSDSRKDGGS